MLWLLKTQPLISKEVSSRAYLRDSSPATVNLKTSNLKSSATAFSSQAGPSSLTKTENLAASIRHGLEIIDSHRSAALKQSSYRFSLRPRESRPTFPVDKVDVGVQTFLDDNVEEDSSMFTCINYKNRAQLDVNEINNSSNLQLVPFDCPESADKPKRHSENGGQGVQFNNPSEHNLDSKGSGEPRRHPENGGQGMHFHEHRVRRTNYSRNPLPSFSREFRVVRDNRVNHIQKDKEVKPPSQHSKSTTEKLAGNTSEKGLSAASINQKPSGARNHQAVNGPSDSHARLSKDAPRATNVGDKKITPENIQGTVSSASARVQPIKPNNIHQNSSATASTSSVVGVYSSSTDPVHVPSPDSRSSGAIRREAGVVGVRRQSSDHKGKHLFPPSSSHANNSVVGKDGTSSDSFQSAGTVQKTEHLSQTAVTEPSFPGVTVSRPSLNNQHNSRPHQQVMGHQRVSHSQHNKEWKPKSS